MKYLLPWCHVWKFWLLSCLFGAKAAGEKSTLRVNANFCRPCGTFFFFGVNHLLKHRPSLSKLHSWACWKWHIPFCIMSGALISLFSPPEAVTFSHTPLDYWHFISLEGHRGTNAHTYKSGLKHLTCTHTHNTCSMQKVHQSLVCFYKLTED